MLKAQADKLSNKARFIDEFDALKIQNKKKNDMIADLERKNFESGTYLQLIKFIYSEKATKFCEISTLLLTVTT